MVSDINKSTPLNTGVSGIGLGETNPKSNSPVGGGEGFSEILKSKVPSKETLKGSLDVASAGVKFSQHAIERMSSRGITFKPEEIQRLNDAVDKAAKKGSRESLVLMGDNALIVSVKNRTVVTAMDRETMKENVFTNIDSTVIL